MVKLLENTFRAVNIGLVNELALMCDRLGINVWEVIDAAATKPFGFMPFYPGPGPGRPLHPDRPVLPVVEGEGSRLRGALHRAGRPRQRRDAALRRRQDRRRAQQPVEGHAGARPVLMLGIAYKRDIDDMRESPALDVMAVLNRRARTSPITTRMSPTLPARDWPGGLDLDSVPLTAETLAAADCVVILTDHRSFDYTAIVQHARLVVDSRNAVKAQHSHVFKLGAPGARP